MTVPASAAGQLFDVAPGVLGWTVHDERLNAPSTAYAVLGGGGWALIDPLRLAPAAARRLGRPSAIVLTAPCHQRAAWEWRSRTGAAVWIPAGSPVLDEAADACYPATAGGATSPGALPAGLQSLPTPGPRGPHSALLHAASGVLLVGDLLLNLPGRGLELLPAAHAEQPGALRPSARLLLNVEWTILCPAHGYPLRDSARQAVRGLAGGPA